jgi:diguanylate cyclase (GGDEF)-like protein/PAS domain S-box-containing protein
MDQPADRPELTDPSAHRHRLAWMELLIDNAPAELAYFDSRSWRCIYANVRYAEANGKTPEWCTGKTAQEILGDATWEAFFPQISTSAQGKSLRYTRPHPLPDGTTRHVDVSVLPHFTAAGHQIGLFVLRIDVTDREEASRQMRLSEERLRKFADATTEGVVIHRNGTIMDVNDALVALAGERREDMVGHNTLEWVPPRLHKTVTDYIAAAKEVPYEAVVVRKDGTEIPVEMVGKTMRYGGEDVRLAVVRDLTERKRSEARIAHMAHFDTLTNLPNRAYLTEYFAEALARAARDRVLLAALFIDLDHFKTVNDSLGHHVGDQLLVAVANRLHGTLRESDFIARLGGDEFFILLPELESFGAAARVASKIISVLSDPFVVEKVPVLVTPSIGIALFPDDGADVATLMRHADAAMYRAKDAGRGTFIFYTRAFSDEVSRTLETAGKLREAITADGLDVHYQPQIDIKSGRVMGIEALVRWPSSAPVGGQPMGPDRFIPIAERQGLIHDLGRWVLRRALTRLAEWHARWRNAGRPLLPIAVNISAWQLKREGFVEDFSALLADTALDPKMIELELTESVLLGEDPVVASTLSVLHSLGVKTSLDDFGTGFSSLSYLKRYPISRLKIDRSFVAGLTTQAVMESTGDAAICRAIVGMARALKLDVVAEGVETQEQLGCLAELDCDAYQGFLVAKPMDAQSLFAWVEGRAKNNQ